MFTLIPLMAADSKVDFARDVAPIFEKRCLGCHGPQMQMSGLRLDQKDSARRVIAAGNSAGSRLIRLVSGTSPDKKVMPPAGARLTAAEVGLLRAWIDQGAVWPEGLSITAARPAHWAF